MIESSPKEQRLFGARTSSKCAAEATDSSYYHGGNDFEAIVVDTIDSGNEQSVKNQEDQSFPNQASISGRLRNLVTALIARKKGK